MNYAYLGEVSPKQFNELHNAFPQIVGGGVNDVGDIVCVCDDDKVTVKVGAMLQTIVQLWDNKEMMKALWDNIICP